MLRIKTPRSRVCRDIRMRSPRTAPPVKGLLGSTAITPTVCPRSRMTLTSASASVLLPVPGAPVSPTRYALPVWGCNSAASSVACGSRSSARLIALASARTSPDSKAPAKLISNASYQRTFGRVGLPLGRRGKGSLREIGAEQDGHAGTGGRRGDRRHHSPEVALQPGHGRGRTPTGAVQDASLRHPLRGGRSQAGVPALRREDGRHDAGRRRSSVGEPV